MLLEAWCTICTILRGYWETVHCGVWANKGWHRYSLNQSNVNFPQFSHFDLFVLGYWWHLIGQRPPCSLSLLHWLGGRRNTNTWTPSHTWIATSESWHLLIRNLSRDCSGRRRWREKGIHRKLTAVSTRGSLLLLATSWDCRMWYKTRRCGDQRLRTDQKGKLQMQMQTAVTMNLDALTLRGSRLCADPRGARPLSSITSSSIRG